MDQKKIIKSYNFRTSYSFRACLVDSYPKGKYNRDPSNMSMGNIEVMPSNAQR